MAAVIGLTGIGVNCTWVNRIDVFIISIVVLYRVGFAGLVLYTIYSARGIDGV